jgi:hypothetical protein
MAAVLINGQSDYEEESNMLLYLILRNPNISVNCVDIRLHRKTVLSFMSSLDINNQYIWEEDFNVHNVTIRQL